LEFRRVLFRSHRQRLTGAAIPRCLKTARSRPAPTTGWPRCDAAGARPEPDRYSCADRWRRVGPPTPPEHQDPVVLTYPAQPPDTPQGNLPAPDQSPTDANPASAAAVSPPHHRTARVPSKGRVLSCVLSTTCAS